MSCARTVTWGRWRRPSETPWSPRSPQRAATRSAPPVAWASAEPRSTARSGPSTSSNPTEGRPWEGPVTSEPFTPGTGDTEPSPRPVVVFGATGGQGGAVVTALLDTSRRVRALVRDKTSRGAVALAERGIELAQADLSDAAALASAMRGAASAFAVTTPFEAEPEQEVAQGEAIISAAQDARLPHLLFTSVASADRDTGIPHFDSKARIESRLRGGDLEYTIVAPTY